MRKFFNIGIGIALSFAFLFFAQIRANAASTYSYSVLYINGSNVLITNGDYSFDIYLPYGCNISSSDLNATIYIDQSISSLVGYGDVIYFHSISYGDQECENYISSAALDFQPYTILDYSSSEGFLVSDGTSDWLIDPSYYCSTSSFDVGSTMYINTSYSPSYGDEIYFNGTYGAEYCEVSNFPTELNFQAYTLLEYLGSDGLLITDSTNYWIAEPSYDCSFSSANENSTVYLDSASPAYGDSIYLPSSYNSQFCTVSNFPEQLHLYAATLSSADTDTATIYIGDNGYIVEYGYGCSSYDFSTADSIAWNSSNGYIDTTDEIYLFDYSGYSYCSIYSITDLPSNTEVDSTTVETEESPTTVDETAPSVEDTNSDPNITEDVEAEKVVDAITIISKKKKKATFNWSVNNPDTSGEISVQVSKKVKGKWKKVRSFKIDGELNSYTIKKLKPGKKYRIRVKYVNSSTWSAWEKFTTKK